VNPSPTRLGSKLAGGANVASPASSVSTKLSRQVTAGRRGEEVAIPVLGRAFMELPGAVTWTELEAANRARMLELFGALAIENAAQYELDFARRVLAVAARDPDDRALPFGTLEEWGALDVDVINLAWQVFGDVRERLDPLSRELSAEEGIAIQSAIKKKDALLLRTYGVVKLSIWLATTDALQSILLVPSSPNSGSPSGISE
jgi:hypothetical protein